MNALQHAALAYVMAIAVICTVGVLVIGIVPGQGAGSLSRMWMTAIAVAPVFLGRFIAQFLWRRRPELLSGRALLVFAAMVLVPAAGLSLLTEAAIIMAVLQSQHSLTLSEVTFALAGDRYLVPVILGMGFFMSQMVATALGVLILVPTHITRISLSQ